MKSETRNIGLDVKTPKDRCTDVNCPFHGTVKIRGRLFRGGITKTDVSNTATVVLYYYNYLRKYERYEKKQTRLKVHNPPCINAKVGDNVLVGETRPISKTKHFAILEVSK
ncbi:30S ribosomal protein S17 [Candidatus Woesearchaeota archaeon]|nr:30S ribosomal protein S17 [Candidatus Woesearchaeota archaeon]